MIPEELPDPKLDIRYYHPGDKVVFSMRKRGSEEKEIREGIVRKTNRYPDGYSTIDMKSGDMICTHYPLNGVIKHYRKDVRHNSDY